MVSDQNGSAASQGHATPRIPRLWCAGKRRVRLRFGTLGRSRGRPGLRLTCRSDAANVDRARVDGRQRAVCRAVHERRSADAAAPQARGADLHGRADRSAPGPRTRGGRCACPAQLRRRPTIDVVRSIAVSQEMLGTREIVVIHHTECGSVRITNDSIRQRLTESLGPDAGRAAGEIDFLPFTDLEQSVRDDMAILKASPAPPARNRNQRLHLRCQDRPVAAGRSDVGACGGSRRRQFRSLNRDVFRLQPSVRCTRGHGRREHGRRCGRRRCCGCGDRFTDGLAELLALDQFLDP